MPDTFTPREPDPDPEPPPASSATPPLIVPPPEPRASARAQRVGTVLSILVLLVIFGACVALFLAGEP